MCIIYIIHSHTQLISTMNKELNVIFETSIRPVVKSKMVHSSGLISSMVYNNIDMDTARSSIDELIELDMLKYVNGISEVFIYLPSDHLYFETAIGAIHEAVKINNEMSSGFLDTIENLFEPSSSSK